MLRLVKSEDNLADWLSRSNSIPVPSNVRVPSPSEIESTVNFVSDDGTIDVKKIREEIVNDEVLKVVFSYVRLGWPENVSDVAGPARFFLNTGCNCQFTMKLCG